MFKKNSYHFITLYSQHIKKSIKLIKTWNMCSISTSLRQFDRYNLVTQSYLIKREQRFEQKTNKIHHFISSYDINIFRRFYNL